MKYEIPTMEIIQFVTEDVIRTSGEGEIYHDPDDTKGDSTDASTGF